MLPQRLPSNRHRLPTNRHRLPTNRHCTAYWTLRVFFFSLRHPLPSSKQRAASSKQQAAPSSSKKKAASSEQRAAFKLNQSLAHCPFRSLFLPDPGDTERPQLVCKVAPFACAKGLREREGPEQEGREGPPAKPTAKPAPKPAPKAKYVQLFQMRLKVGKGCYSTADVRTNVKGRHFASSHKHLC